MTSNFESCSTRADKQQRRLGEVYNGQPNKKTNVAVIAPARSSIILSLWKSTVEIFFTLTEIANVAIMQCLSNHPKMTAASDKLTGDSKNSYKAFAVASYECSAGKGFMQPPIKCFAFLELA